MRKCQGFWNDKKLFMIAYFSSRFFSSVVYKIRSIRMWCDVSCHGISWHDITTLWKVFIDSFSRRFTFRATTGCPRRQRNVFVFRWHVIPRTSSVRCEGMTFSGSERLFATSRQRTPRRHGPRFGIVVALQAIKIPIGSELTVDNTIFGAHSTSFHPRG